MKIIPNQSFKHERETYEKGKEYDVSEDLAHYFTNVGWVGGPESELERTTLTKDDVATLKVHNGAVGVRSEVK